MARKKCNFCEERFDEDWTWWAMWGGESPPREE